MTTTLVTGQTFTDHDEETTFLGDQLADASPPTVRALEPLLTSARSRPPTSSTPPTTPPPGPAPTLVGSGIAVPPFAAYVDRLVAFVRAHPEIGSAAMV